MKHQDALYAAEELQLHRAISEAISVTKNREDLFKLIFSELEKMFTLSMAGISILDRTKTHLEVFLGSTFVRDEQLNHLIKRQITPVAGTIFISMMETRQPVHVEFEKMEKEFVRDEDKEILKTLVSFGITDVVLTPIITGGDIIGFMMIGSKGDKRIQESQIPLLQKIVNNIGPSVKNYVIYDRLLQQDSLKNILLKMNNALAQLKDRDKLLLEFTREMHKVIPVKYLGLNIKMPVSRIPVSASFILDKAGDISQLQISKNQDIPILVLKGFCDISKNQLSREFLAEEFSILCGQSMYFRSLQAKYELKTIHFNSFMEDDGGETNLIIAKYDNQQLFEREIEFLHSIVPQFSFILKNFFAYEEINSLKQQLEKEKTLWIEEINLNDSFQEIIGSSIEIQNMLYKIKQVAPIDATVLIQGETGTGKELIAHAVHNISSRKNKALVKVNCAALPAQLIESDLFGHEKGSFTGAIESRIGKFELANGGTIFLDEIGEMPFELQAKLLRVLQEGEFERVGGKSVIKTDVRVIAATNRQLVKEVEAGKFRSDLFFRLNVFPVTAPPLRDRLEDIPLLVKYFMEKYSKRVGKPITSIKKMALDALCDYTWPGNVRELEHVIERAVIVAHGQTLEPDQFIFSSVQPAEIEPVQIKTMEEIEVEHIIRALKAAKGKVTGDGGAADLLGLNGKTLASRMRKLGIKRETMFSRM